MRLRGPVFLSLLVIGLLVAAFYPPVDNEQKEAVLIQTILGGLQQLHYAPLAIDDSFSEKAYDLYLERIDGAHRWFTQADIDRLDAFKYDIDNEANEGTYGLLNLSIELTDAALDKTQTYYREALSKPFSFTDMDELELDGDKRGYAQNDAELQAFWNQLMKYETLTRLSSKLEEQAKGTNEELVGKSQADLEAEARADVLKAFDDWYGRLEKRKRSDHLNVYLNVLTNVFDPHTGYFEPIEKQNFDIRMSGKLEGIGARLQTDGDYTKVVSIVVGGPAWKQGELEEGDRIVRVRQASEDEALDISGMTIDDVVQLIRGDKGTRVVLTVKKVDGSSVEIPIVRDVVVLEEGFAKSLILHTSSKEKIGYIRLPSFYADFQDSNGRSSARDVATEIAKLKAENVQGILIDLRNNGGGSLRDVVDMTGLFIEDGPIVQVKSRDRSPEVLTDDNPSVLWNGPVVVMVNNYSASASEILAAALQDYERAVIVGTTSTFGKGTVQRFFDLDRAIRGNTEVKPLGEIKLTTQKFYRINGGSTQLRGVTPDIILPDPYSLIELGEKEQDFPLEWTSIDPVAFNQDVYMLPDLDLLRQNSARRVASNEAYTQIKTNAARLKEQRDDSKYSLNLETYQTEEAAREAEREAYEGLFDHQVVFGISNLAVDLPEMEGDEGKIARNEEWIKDTQKDIDLQECLNVIHDMLEFQ
ncbi:MAG: carboxy terminal-processing peptidase [Saprospiraceae bacterium]|nr:carboxy terminal-processing peptidase [Saprospiraceae bacterium]